MTGPVRIPSDIDREDQLLGPLTARQLTILGVTALLLYGVWTFVEHVVPVWVFLAVAAPIVVAVATLVLVRRDGVPLERLALAALTHARQPREQVAADQVLAPPEWATRAATDTHGRPWSHSAVPAPLGLPATGVGETGLIDLGADGVAVVAVCSTVNFALRTPGEQAALVGVFARLLHSLTAPVQLLIRAARIELGGQIAELRAAAPGLPPALEAACVEHADYLDQLSRSTVLLRRQVLLVLREPLHPHGISPRSAPQGDGDAVVRAAETRVARRLAEAADVLAPAGITVTPLASGQARAVLTAACNPESALPTDTAALLARPEEVITTTDPEDTA
ncbi:PrgI family protein [Allokutzneria sp. A3M-2-11 16]|uniref:PrgI family protein n=1 Tax=Allokutzneria sp. A3M-2-11 16 TaxID=2962043 RepID=UPI0020B719A1|nr:PrgI family protein [Allokutzneria sp. A3M-2-11 16]MCP3800725.1 PrgI family protein [Allokutzneria sp. A3M-2-11 16]